RTVFYRKTCWAARFSQNAASIRRQRVNPLKLDRKRTTDPGRGAHAEPVLAQRLRRNCFALAHRVASSSGRPAARPSTEALRLPAPVPRQRKAIDAATRIGVWLRKYAVANTANSSLPSTVTAIAVANPTFRTTKTSATLIRSAWLVRRAQPVP